MGWKLSWFDSLSSMLRGRKAIIVFYSFRSNYYNNLATTHWCDVPMPAMRNLNERIALRYPRKRAYLSKLHFWCISQLNNLHLPAVCTLFIPPGGRIQFLLLLLLPRCFYEMYIASGSQWLHLVVATASGYICIHWTIVDSVHPHDKFIHICILVCVPKYSRVLYFRIWVQSPGAHVTWLIYAGNIKF